ncbi:MAG: VOC family protein [Acidimicrobiia bacterium]
MEFRMYPQLPASDLARAEAWYSEKLGVEPTEPGDELFYDTGTAQFGIYPSDNAGTNKATAVRLVVEDFDAARAELLTRGVVFENYDLGEDFRTVDGILHSPDGEKTAWFKDSEGNILALGSSL